MGRWVEFLVRRVRGCDRLGVRSDGRVHGGRVRLR